MAALNRQWGAEIPAASRRLALFSRPDDVRAGGTPGTGGTWNEARVRLVTGHVMNDLGSFHRYLVGASRASADILKRQMTINAVINEPLNWNAELGNAAAVQSYIDARLDLQTRQSYRGIARQAEQWVLYLKAVFQGLYYAVFPIALLMMLSPMGVIVLRNYLFGLVWIESWGPLYAVINYFVSAGAQNRMTALVNASGGAAGGTTGGDIPLIAQAGIRAVEADIAVQAGYLLMSVPFIAIALAAGAGRFAMLATSTLAVSQEAVADTTRESATGNMSVGNTSHDTHAFHNYTGFSHNSSAAWDSDRTSAYADSGAVVTQTGDGRMVVAGQHSQSSFATDVNWGRNLSSSLSRQASESRQAAETTGTALADSQSAMRSLTTGFTDSVMAGRGHDFAYGADTRVTASEDVNTITSAAQDWARRQGVNEKDAIDASIAATVALKAFGNGADARAAYQASTSSDISFDEALKFTESEDVREALGRLTSASSSESARWQTGENRNYADSVSAAYNQTRELRESRDASLQEAERFEAAASLVESRSSSINASLGQPFLEWLQTQPSLHGEGSMSFQEAEALLNDRTLEGRSRAVLLADRFLETEAHRYIDDPEVAAMMRRIDPEGTYGQDSAAIRGDADIAGAHLRHAGSVPTEEGEKIRADNRAATQRVRGEAEGEIAGTADEIGQKGAAIRGRADAGSETIGDEVRRDPVERFPGMMERVVDRLGSMRQGIQALNPDTPMSGNVGWQTTGDVPTMSEDGSGFTNEGFRQDADKAGKQAGEMLDGVRNRVAGSPLGQSRPMSETAGWQSTGDMPSMADDGSDWTAESFGEAVDRAGQMLGNARTDMPGPRNAADPPTTTSGQPSAQPDIPLTGQSQANSDVTGQPSPDRPQTPSVGQDQTVSDAEAVSRSGTGRRMNENKTLDGDERPEDAGTRSGGTRMGMPQRGPEDEGWR